MGNTISLYTILCSTKLYDIVRLYITLHFYFKRNKLFEVTKWSSWRGPLYHTKQLYGIQGKILLRYSDRRT